MNTSECAFTIKQGAQVNINKGGCFKYQLEAFTRGLSPGISLPSPSPFYYFIKIFPTTMVLISYVQLSLSHSFSLSLSLSLSFSRSLSPLSEALHSERNVRYGKNIPTAGGPGRWGHGLQTPKASHCLFRAGRGGRLGMPP